MRCSVKLVQVFQPTAWLLTSTSKPPSDGQAPLERLRQEAESKGFASRDTLDDKILLQKTFDSTETISDTVVVANMPAKVKEETQFDKYQRSTTDFTSFVSPHGVSGVGLGAGFGAREDKRLGFLRPRQSLQPSTGSSEIVPKYDENGMPVEGQLTREQLMRKKMEYMKSFDGMTLSCTEHFLLVDLDYAKDAVLFGNTREEFERNVRKMKNVIIAYNKWERTDNFYYYSTIILKLFTLWVLMECLHQFYELRLLADYYDEFAVVMEAEIADLDARRRRDFDHTAAQLEHHRPNFEPVLRAIATEKQRVEEEKARRIMVEQADDQADVGSALSTAHPMDTTGAEEFAERARATEQSREMQRLHASATHRESTVSAVWRRITGRRAVLPPLSESDYARYSYAASPTSIDSVRLVRRSLLPRSEDYTQVVREHMLEYKRAKDNRTHFSR